MKRLPFGQSCRNQRRKRRVLMMEAQLIQRAEPKRDLVDYDVEMSNSPYNDVGM